MTCDLRSAEKTLFIIWLEKVDYLKLTIMKNDELGKEKKRPGSIGISPCNSHQISFFSYTDPNGCVFLIFLDFRPSIDIFLM